jgi:hypothetical protein
MQKSRMQATHKQNTNKECKFIHSIEESRTAKQLIFSFQLYWQIKNLEQTRDQMRGLKVNKKGAIYLLISKLI